MRAVDTAYPHTITLDSVYASTSQSGCELFRQGTVGVGIDRYQYVITFDSNVGDLPALSVDGSNLVDSTNLNETIATVRGFPKGPGVFYTLMHEQFPRTTCFVTSSIVYLIATGIDFFFFAALYVEPTCRCRPCYPRCLSTSLELEPTIGLSFSPTHRNCLHATFTRCNSGLT